MKLEGAGSCFDIDQSPGSDPISFPVSYGRYILGPRASQSSRMRTREAADDALGPQAQKKQAMCPPKTFDEVRRMVSIFLALVLLCIRYPSIAGWWFGSIGRKL